MFNNCSTENEGYSRQFTLPLNNNQYVVEGYLLQNERVAYCTDLVTYNSTDTTGFGIMGLFGAFLMIASLVLIYAGQGELTIAAAIIGLVVSWVIGLMNFHWMEVSSLIAFLSIVAFVGRHSRKQT